MGAWLFSDAPRALGSRLGSASRRLDAEGGGCPRRPRLPWGRPHSTLRRCAGSRPGSGWDRVGPARSRPRAPPTPGTPETRRPCLRQGRGKCSCRVAHAPCLAPSRNTQRLVLPAVGGTRPLPVEVSSPPPGADRSDAAQRHRMCTLSGCPPSTIRTARLQSVARGPPAAYQPGHLPGVLPHKEWGCSSWGGIPA
jgi:hypothetical protein